MRIPLIYKLIRHECIEFLKQPPLWVLVLLPILMSKMIIGVMSKAGQEYMLLPSWILFAQVMVGVMITAPNFIEEKEHKTLDALMISPLTLHEIIIAKSTTILLFSLISQLMVYTINVGFTFEIITVIPVMIVGGIIFIQVGMVIGLLMNSSQTASAVASIVMVTLFIIGTIYQALPDWERVLQFIPSVVIAENILAIFNGQFLKFEIALLHLWVIALSTSVFYLAVKEQKK